LASTGTDSAYVSEKPNPTVYLGSDTTLCEGRTLRLNADYSNASYLLQDNTVNCTYLVSKDGAYRVSVNHNNCIVSDIINIYYSQKPHFTLGANLFICQGQTVTLQLSLNQQWQFKWQDGSTKEIYKVTKPGLYFVDATNTCGTSREEVFFTNGLCKVYVPNAFKSNGDSKNDIFKVSGTELFTEFHLQIYNRYGQLIFESKDKNKGWDGTIKNQQAEKGNYVYLLQYRESTTVGMQRIKGSCLLIR